MPLTTTAILMFIMYFFIYLLHISVLESIGFIVVFIFLGVECTLSKLDFRLYLFQIVFILYLFMIFVFKSYLLDWI